MPQKDQNPVKAAKLLATSLWSGEEYIACPHCGDKRVEILSFKFTDTHTSVDEVGVKFRGRECGHTFTMAFTSQDQEVVVTATSD